MTLTKSLLHNFGLILLLALVFAPVRAEAGNGVAIQISGGPSLFRLKAGSTFDRDGGFGLELRPQINLEFTSLSSAFTVFYQGRLGSNFGSYPISRVGSGIQYYPAGLPMRKTVLDSGVALTENRFVPFLSANLLLASIAVTDPSQQQPFNGLSIGYQVGGGGEFPITTSAALMMQVLYEGTASGSGAAATGIQLQAYGALFGIAIHP